MHMVYICTSNRANKYLISNRILSVFIAVAFFSFSGISQLAELEVNELITSGVIVELGQESDLGVVQIILDDLDSESATEVYREFSKYSGEIVGLGMSILEKKIIISYREPINPNFLLAILDRINLRAFYDENGDEIYYVKDGNSSFIR